LDEKRSLALLVMVRRYAKQPDKRMELFAVYIAKRHRVNNWDLVDASAEHIIGPQHNPRLLTHLAKSKSVWERRIAIMATFHCIKHGEFAETLRIAKRLLHGPHDLIHKAIGWCSAKSASATRRRRKRSSASTPTRCRARCCGTRSSGSRQSCGSAI
jgi:3-methyladenine DNA glycosylase AlkD